jgi:hypothetical protein
MLAASDLLESAQRRDDGSPRFHIPTAPQMPGWSSIAAAEADGGYLPELRLFLDAQLEAGDFVVDTAVGAGIMLLSAGTAPGGTPQVFAVGNAGHSAAIDAAAIDAGCRVDWWPPLAYAQGGLTARLLELAGPDSRVFVHADVRSVIEVIGVFAPLIARGLVTAICVSPDARDAALERAQATAALRAGGFVLHDLREQHGEPALFAVAELEADTPVIAIAGSAPATQTEPVASATTEVTTAPPSFRTAHAPAATAFSFIAPYCRTGYGVVGAHLVREFGRLDANVAYFPLGGIDQSVVETPTLPTMLARQGSYDDQAPSVRLSQQFDLALHVGRGPRIGFPIFELDRFRPNERHQLLRQDRLLVTCEWAKRVLLDDGISVPIDIVPLGVDRTVFHEGVMPVKRAAHETVFMQVGKLEPRKGQRELLRAFEAAFTPKDPVRLVLVCHNPFVSEAQFNELAAPFRRSPMASRITLITKPFATQRDLAPQMAAADAAVFAVRAEGWNLEALEMLSMGKTVIATDYSAHTAFLTPANARLIAVDALEQPAGAMVGRWAAWGDAQHEQLVAHLRAVHAEKQQGTLARNEAGIATSQHCSWTASAQALLASITHA